MNCLENDNLKKLANANANNIFSITTVLENLGQIPDNKT